MSVLQPPEQPNRAERPRVVPLGFSAHHVTARWAALARSLPPRRCTDHDEDTRSVSGSARSVLLQPADARSAQPEPAKGATAEQESASVDPLGRATPHGTVVGLIAAAGQDNLDRAAEYLESGLEPAERRELARQTVGRARPEAGHPSGSRQPRARGRYWRRTAQPRSDRSVRGPVRQRRNVPGPRPARRPPGVVVLIGDVGGDPTAL